MHILVITPGFPENEKDTSCVPPMQEFFRHLNNSGKNITISVIAVHYPYKKLNYKWHNISVYPLNTNDVIQPFRMFFWLKAILYAVKIHKKKKINIIHSFWLNENALIASIISKLIGLKHINTMMGQDAVLRSKISKLLPVNLIYKIAVSDFQARKFNEATGIEVQQIIEWGIEKNDSPVVDRDIDILGVGSLIPVKNFSLFVEIICKLKESMPGLNCILVGDGFENDKIKDMISNYRLSSNLKMTGEIKREEVLALMERSKVFLHTSNYESFGYVLAEALSCGCYVVSRNTGIAYNNSKIFTADSESEFLSVIKNILITKKDFNPLVLFQLENTVDKYFNLYKKLSGT